MLERRAFSQKDKIALPFPVRHGLAQILERELAMMRAVQHLRDELRQRPSFAVYSLFHFVDTESTYYISSEDVIRFMRTQGTRLTPEQVRAVLRRLDSDRDGKVSYLDFEYTLCGTTENLSIRDLSPVRKEPATEPRERLRSRKFRAQFSSPEPRRLVLLSRYGSPKRTPAEPKPFREEAKLISPETAHDERSPDTEVSPSRVLIPRELPDAVTPDKGQISPQVATPATGYETLPNSPYTQKRTESSEHFSLSRVAPEPSPEVKARLAKIFRAQIALDRENEEAKERLCERDDFTVHDAFSYFDAKGLGTLSLHELRAGFAGLDIPKDTESLLLLMRRYDLDANGRLEFIEFERMMLPYDKKFISALTGRIPQARNGELGFAGETKKLFAECVESLVKVEMVAERVRTGQAADLDLGEAFVCCAAEGKDYLTKDSVFAIIAITIGG